MKITFTVLQILSHRQAPNKTCAAAVEFRWPRFVGGVAVVVVAGCAEPNSERADNPNFASRSSSNSFASQDSE
jgi:hypothetical protein